MGRDKVMFWVENLADRFDNENEQPYNLEFDYYEYAMNFNKVATEFLQTLNKLCLK